MKRTNKTNKNKTGQPVFIIFAGINGSGKTSLYRSMSNNEYLGVRVNIDEFARENGSANDPVNIVISGRRALSIADDCIKNRISFNEETTLPGVVIEKQLKAAKENGFITKMYFVGLKNVETAIERVRKRYECGGHFIPEPLIRKRYNNLPLALSRILPYIDYAFFFDNSEMFKEVAVMENGKVLDVYEKIPEWFYYYFPELQKPNTL